MIVIPDKKMFFRNYQHFFVAETLYIAWYQTWLRAKMV